MKINSRILRRGSEQCLARGEHSVNVRSSFLEKQSRGGVGKGGGSPGSRVRGPGLQLQLCGRPRGARRQATPANVHGACPEPPAGRGRGLAIPAPAFCFQDYVPLPVTGLFKSSFALRFRFFLLPDWYFSTLVSVPFSSCVLRVKTTVRDPFYGLNTEAAAPSAPRWSSPGPSR